MRIKALPGARVYGFAAMSDNVIAVDARGLEPPQPLVRILEALATLPDGAELRAQTDRRPMHLYGFLEERGFVGTSEDQPDGSFITVIRRK
jgi:TusA-related sulfurtransferase